MPGIRRRTSPIVRSSSREKVPTLYVMVSPCSRMRSAFTATSFNCIVPGSRYTVSGKETLSSGIDFLAKLIIDTSRRQPATVGTDMANPPSAFDDANFFILPSAPFTITDAPATGSLPSASRTEPVTATCAMANGTARTANSDTKKALIRRNPVPQRIAVHRISVAQ